MHKLASHGHNPVGDMTEQDCRGMATQQLGICDKLANHGHTPVGDMTEQDCRVMATTVRGDVAIRFRDRKANSWGSGKWNKG